MLQSQELGIANYNYNYQPKKHPIRNSVSIHVHVYSGTSLKGYSV